MAHQLVVQRCTLACALAARAGSPEPFLLDKKKRAHTHMHTMLSGPVLHKCMRYTKTRHTHLATRCTNSLSRHFQNSGTSSKMSWTTSVLRTSTICSGIRSGMRSCGMSWVTSLNSSCVRGTGTSNRSARTSTNCSTIPSLTHVCDRYKLQRCWCFFFLYKYLHPERAERAADS